MHSRMRVCGDADIYSYMYVCSILNNLLCPIKFGVELRRATVTESSLVCKCMQRVSAV